MEDMVTDVLHGPHATVPLAGSSLHEVRHNDYRDLQGQLAESRDRFEKLYNFAPIGYATITSRGKIHDINVTGADMLDYPRSRLVNMPFSVYVDQRDKHLFKNHLRQCNSGKAKVVSELRVITRNAKTLHIQLTSVAVAEILPNQLSFRSAFVDITDLKEAQQELVRARDEMEKRVAERTEELARLVEAQRESENFLRILLEKLPVGIGVYDEQGTVILTNNAENKLCGVRDMSKIPDDLNPPRSLATGRVLSAEEWPVARALRGETVVESLEIPMESGPPQAVIANAQPLEAGAHRGALVVLEDITEHRKLEQQLLQSQKMESIGLLAGGIAHDFNNILMGITGYTQMVHSQLQDDDLRGALELVMQSADRAADLTQNLLAFSRKQILNPKPLDINRIIANISKIITRVIGEDIEYVTDLSQQDVFVFADQSRIEQVLVNLAINARDAMPEGGRIVVSTGTHVFDPRSAAELEVEAGIPFCVIKVCDNGSGMKEQDRDRIFEPFFTTKETGRGTGLGLAIIYGIVKQHKGTIVVESEEGKGSTFSVYLPVADETACIEGKSQQQRDPRGSEKILVVEDDQMVRGFLEKALALAGYSVVTARNGEDAVAYLKENPDVALVVSDVVMPRQNGKEMFDSISCFNPEVKVLFISGYPADIVSSKGILGEELSFLQKPVSRPELLRKVREILDA